MTTGEKIRAARKAIRMTQEQLAAKLDMSRTTIVAIEDGSRTVKAHELPGIAYALGIPAEMLLSDDNDELAVIQGMKVWVALDTEESNVLALWRQGDYAALLHLIAERI
jgi:transcriptional regulator with XRE-family HTH domain